MIRRNLPIVYIIENNGVYGLTKGQFSATADEGSKQKNGDSNPFVSIDLCALAIELGCGYVARSFSGDAKQLVPLISAAFRHNGTAVIDVISPCVTFANHEGSTKSYTAVKDHNYPLQQLGFIQPQTEITVDYEAGSTVKIELHDGSFLTLTKLRDTDHDLKDAGQILAKLHATREQGQIVTGLLHYRGNNLTLMDRLDLNTDKPLAALDESDTRPSRQMFEEMLGEFR
jgi:2-oxoglutarate ferredoxin oxidoreductase subunit beta